MPARRQMYNIKYISMAKYETPPKVRSLEKLIRDFSYKNGHDPITVFNDFLVYIIHGFSPGAPPLRSWKYKRQENVAFMNMVQEWIRIMERETRTDGWCDPFGDLYMVLASQGAKQSQGQFFTPEHICELMVSCAILSENTPGRRVNDPTCGSGRLLLAWHSHCPEAYLVGEDINRTCCLMTVCNMLVHGCVGEVICHDSLNPQDFVDGWKVNPILGQTGLPTIKRMTREEYVLSRSGLHPAHKVRQAARDMFGDKVRIPGLLPA